MSSHQKRYTDALTEEESALLFNISEYARSLTPESRVKLVERTDVGEDMDDAYALIFTRLLETMGAIDHRGTVGILHDTQARVNFIQEINSGFGCAHLPTACGEREQAKYKGKYHSPICKPRIGAVGVDVSLQVRLRRRAGASSSSTSRHPVENPLCNAGENPKSLRGITALEIGEHQTAWKCIRRHKSTSTNAEIDKIVTQGGLIWDSETGRLLPDPAGNNNKYDRKASTNLVKYAQKNKIPITSSSKVTALQTKLSVADCDFRESTGHTFADTCFTYANDLPKKYWENACDPKTQVGTFTPKFTLDIRVNFQHEVTNRNKEEKFAAGYQGDTSQTEEEFVAEASAYWTSLTDYDTARKAEILAKPVSSWEQAKMTDSYMLPQYDFWSVFQAVPDLAAVLDVFDEEALQDFDGTGMSTNLGIPDVRGGLKVSEAEFAFKTIIKAAMLAANTSSYGAAIGETGVTTRSGMYKHVHTKDADGVWRYEVVLADD